MSDQYYYARGTTPLGPFSAAHLRELAAAGDLLPTDSVWRQGTEQRVSAARVKNLFAGDQVPAWAAGAGGTARPVPAVLLAQAATGSPGTGAPATTPSDAPSEGKLFVAAPPRAPQQQARKMRVTGIKGGILMSQDGVDVQFRKKCKECGYEDSCRSKATIRLGSMRVPFFCPKCRKTRAVEITGMS